MTSTQPTETATLDEWHDRLIRSISADYDSREGQVGAPHICLAYKTIFEGNFGEYGLEERNFDRSYKKTRKSCEKKSAAEIARHDDGMQGAAHSASVSEGLKPSMGEKIEYSARWLPQATDDGQPEFYVDARFEGLMTNEGPSWGSAWWSAKAGDRQLFEAARKHGPDGTLKHISFVGAEGEMFSLDRTKAGKYNYRYTVQDGTHREGESDLETVLNSVHDDVLQSDSTAPEEETKFSATAAPIIPTSNE